MAKNLVLASVTRIADLERGDFTISPVPRGEWECGDYVVLEVLNDPGSRAPVELSTGRMVEVHQGDRIVGALGVRSATLELVGDWRAVDADLELDMLTPAGLVGRITSSSTFVPEQSHGAYRGHLIRNGQKLTMGGFVAETPAMPLRVPVVLIVGTSMSAGKTSAAKVAIRLLKDAGLRVVGVKLTGAARYRDILVMGDAGADQVLDFVDVGLPSTVCAPQVYRQRLACLLSRVAGCDCDVLVAEAGASPLEPYNGSVAVEELYEQVKVTILCASDPYAALGVMEAFGRRAHLVAGPATNTESGIALVDKLTGTRAVNVLDRRQHPELQRLLCELLELGAGTVAGAVGDSA